MERAARVIYQRTWDGAPLHRWDDCEQWRHDMYRETARQALAAILPPGAVILSTEEVDTAIEAATFRSFAGLGPDRDAAVRRLIATLGRAS